MVFSSSFDISLVCDKFNQYLELYEKAQTDNKESESKAESR